MSLSGRRSSASRVWNRLSARLSRRGQTERLLRGSGPSTAWQKFANRFALVLLIGTFVVSLAHVMIRGRTVSTDSGKEVLTLAHWQLEPGVRRGFELGAQKFNEMRRANDLPEIVFKQLPITEKGYGQWVTTQLMGGTAPDLIEMGLGLPWAVWLNYRARYFVPITQEIMKPNRFNKDFVFDVGSKKVPGDQIPWKETYIDSMGRPIWELQEYYDIGLSTFSQRLFYNRELLKKLTAELAAQGKWPRAIEEPPQDLRAFFELCDAMAELKDERGRPYLPLAGSAYQFGVMNSQMLDPLTVVLMDSVDENMDGWAGNDETFFSILQGKAKFDDPQLLKVMGLSRELAKRFQSGWKGLNRDDAVMLFTQRRSVFIASGSWDGNALVQNARDQAEPFTVHISPFPAPSPSDPEWGDIAFGRNYENSSMGFAFGLTATSKHPQLALDFLRFLSSQKMNEEFNNEIGWIPAVKGAKPNEFLAAFAPNFDGIRKGWELNMGGKSDTVVNQVTPLLCLGQDEKGQPFTVNDWAARMQKEWIPAAATDFEQRDEVERDNLKSKESIAGLLRAKMLLFAGTEQGDYYQKRYMGYVGETVDSPRKISRWQARLREAREKGLVR
jgi:raffinose/stachyose/melibiose transport system substrate-binding protein